jgi:hypothetical protein
MSAHIRCRAASWWAPRSQCTSEKGQVCRHRHCPRVYLELLVPWREASGQSVVVDTVAHEYSRDIDERPAAAQHAGPHQPVLDSLHVLGVRPCPQIAHPPVQEGGDARVGAHHAAQCRWPMHDVRRYHRASPVDNLCNAAIASPTSWAPRHGMARRRHAYVVVGDSRRCLGEGVESLAQHTNHGRLANIVGRDPPYKGAVCMQMPTAACRACGYIWRAGTGALKQSRL